jgi:hypothetical protein
VDVYVADNTVLVHDEQGPLAASILAEYTIHLGHRPMRPEITEQRKADAAQALGPGLQARHMVHTDTQHLGIVPFERTQIQLVRRDLVRSDGRPGQREKGDQNVMFALIFAELDFVVQVTLEPEIWSFHTNLDYHTDPPCVFLISISRIITYYRHSVKLGAAR